MPETAGLTCPKEIVVTNHELLVDGKPFPWYIAENGIEIVAPGGDPTTIGRIRVQIEVLADAVTDLRDGV